MQETIGIGNFGRVIKALNKTENKIRALKIVSKESVAYMKQVDHLISEREVLLDLSTRNNSCPFIMDIFSSFQDDENLYFELDYIEGCTLLSQIRLKNRGVMSAMAFYAGEVIVTLEYLHSNRIIYRDLKPENIVLSKHNGGHMKLVDFGFAKQMK